ncbi:MAG: hypothetical protein ABI581_08910 [Sediminibacterium sp.]
MTFEEKSKRVGELGDIMRNPKATAIERAAARIKEHVIFYKYLKFDSTETEKYILPHSDFNNLAASLEADPVFTVTRVKDRDEWEVKLSPIYELNQSLIKANESAVKMNDVTLPENFRVQKKLTGWSLILAGLTVFITLASLIKQCNQDNLTTESQLLLRQQLQVQGDSLRTHQMRLDSLLRAKKEDGKGNDTTKSKL